MNLTGYISSFLDKQDNVYERIKQGFNFYKCTRYFGRAVTLHEIINLFTSQAVKAGMEVSREKIYLAVTHAMNAQLFTEDILLKNLEEYSPNLEYAVRREIKRKEEKYFNNELRVVVPKSLEFSYERLFKDYYTTRFLSITHPSTAIKKARESIEPELRNATGQVTGAASDGETLTFLASFYMGSLSMSDAEARNEFSERVNRIFLTERMQRKYDMTDEDVRAFRYVLHKVLQKISRKR